MGPPLLNLALLATTEVSDSRARHQPCHLDVARLGVLSGTAGALALACSTKAIPLTQTPSTQVPLLQSLASREQWLSIRTPPKPASILVRM